MIQCFLLSGYRLGKIAEATRDPGWYDVTVVTGCFGDFVNNTFAAVADVGNDRSTSSVQNGFALPGDQMYALRPIDFDVAASGHGNVGGKSDIAAYRHYLEELRDAVAAGIAAGDSLEEMQASILMEPYSSWINYENWRPLNVLGMYNMLTGD